MKGVAGLMGGGEEIQWGGEVTSSLLKRDGWYRPGAWSGRGIIAPLPKSSISADLNLNTYYIDGLSAGVALSDVVLLLHPSNFAALAQGPMMNSLVPS